MPSAREIESTVPVLVNARSQIEKRVAAGRIPWIGPLLLVTARSILLVVFQGLMALLFIALHRASPWRAAGDWWAVYGTLVDIGCLIGLKYYTKREGIRLRDLLGPIRMRRGHDLFLGLGFYLLAFPFFIGASYFARILLYGPTDNSLFRYVLHMQPLPIWATAYSLTLWWMIWSPTEEATYNAYALPRLQALTGRTWVAFILVGFWWTAQHCAIPFILDGRFLLYRFLAFLPGVLVLMLIYLRTRRLAPLIIAHWPMDIAGAVITSIF